MIERFAPKVSPDGCEFIVGPYKATVDKDSNLIAWDTRDNRLLRKEEKVTAGELDAILTSIEEMANEEEQSKDDTFKMKRFVSYKLIKLQGKDDKPETSLYDYLTEKNLHTTDREEINKMLLTDGYWYVADHEFEEAWDQSNAM